ncbi:MAG: copper ion binding protein, partial [Candidatus Nanoarchaeia archaeon]
MKMAKDPVCGMEVDEAKAEGRGLTTVKDGKKYHFCSKHCKESFGGKHGSQVGPKNEKVSIPITGMTCVSCAKTIESSIKNVKGVSDANINFAAEKALVEYDASIAKREDIEAAIEDAGYNVVKKPEGQAVLKLKVIGMDNPHCVGIVGSALAKLDGIESKELLVTEKATIRYDPSVISIRKIKKQIRDVGYEPLDEEMKDAEKEAREKEVRSLKMKVMISGILGLPLLYFAMAPHINLPLPDLTAFAFALIQFFLTVPIMFAGYQFFTRGFTAVIKTRTANMDTLVAIGTGTAFIYSVIATIMIFIGTHSFGLKDIYFEVAGLLIAFILLGRYLEAVAKGKTSAAIKKL